MEQQFYNFKLGVNYPHPIIDIDTTRRKASDALWEMRNNKLVKSESARILKKHALSKKHLNKT